MLGYVWRRLLWTLPVLVGVVVLLFLLLQLIPGDPALSKFGDRPPSEQSLRNVQEKLRLTEPLSRRFAAYLGGVARGDFGDSYVTGEPVGEIIARTLPPSLSLAFLAVIMELAIAIPAGVLAAVYRDTWIDRLSFIIATLLVAMPVFLLGLFSQLVFAIKLSWFPVGGFGDGGLAYHIMPATVMALIAAAYLTRVTRSSMLDVLGSDYVRAARADGLPEGRIIFVHALRNALPPILALAGLHFGLLIGSAVATEYVFDWPGLGRRLYTAVAQRDRPLIIGATLTLSFLFVLVNLGVDIVQGLINPKVRLAGRGRLDV